eukprot:4445850-Pyramimonas_sp.AAC.2
MLSRCHAVILLHWYTPAADGYHTAHTPEVTPYYKIALLYYYTPSARVNVSQAYMPDHLPTLCLVRNAVVTMGCSVARVETLPTASEW